MTVTAEIAKLLKISLEAADKVRTQMGVNGLDFSGCSQREFNAAAKEAKQELMAQGAL